MRRAAALAFATALCASGCAHEPAVPVSTTALGIPVFPGAQLQSKPAHVMPAFAVYRTQSSVEEVYRWYLLRLPRSTPHAYSAAKRQATFALFAAHSRRTIHLQRSGDGTSILLTDTSS